MQNIESILITTGSGIILPAKSGIAYQIFDWSIRVASGTALCLFFGNTWDDDGELFWSLVSDDSDVFHRPDAVPGNIPLFVGEEKRAVSIHTDPATTPDDFSYLWYAEVPSAIG